jgi:hypothetical protein
MRTGSTAPNPPTPCLFGLAEKSEAIQKVNYLSS